MKTLSDRSNKTAAKQFLWFIARVLRTLVVVAVLYMVIVFFLGWFLPHTLIFFTLMAMLWYFVRTGEWTRFSPRALCVLAAGMIAIIPSIVLEREWMLGGGAAVLALTFLVIISYFVLTGEEFRFSLRTLFVFMTGIAVITAIATQVPCWPLGGDPLWPVWPDKL